MGYQVYFPKYFSKLTLRLRLAPTAVVWPLLHLKCFFSKMLFVFFILEEKKVHWQKAFHWFRWGGMDGGVPNPTE